MKLTKTQIKTLTEIMNDYKTDRIKKYASDILDSEMVKIVEILAKNKCATWTRQFMSDLISVDNMCECILNCEF